jgi:hypothetical protein
MFRISVCACVYLLLAGWVLPVNAQQPAAASANVAVPPMVNFSGVLTEANGKPHTGTVGVTFYLYKDSQGGAPLWMETQNVQVDKAGHYTAALGSTTSQGLPATVFASGEARWLGVQVQGQAEQTRVLLMSVPYALKALDAETIGGRPASSFLLAPAGAGSSAKDDNLPPGSITGSGTTGFVPVFTGTTTIGNSKLFQTVGNNVGIGTTTPAAKLDVKGTSAVRDTLTLFPKLTHPVLSVHGTSLSVSNTGQVTFVAGQNFPGTGTVTSVGSGTGLTGGPITKSGTLSIASGGVTNAMLLNPSLTVKAGTDLTGGGSLALGGSTTLNLDTSKVPQLNTANTFTGNQTVNGNLSTTGVVSASSYQIGSNLFAFGSYSNGNASMGFAGNTTMTGLFNTASGKLALSSNTTGNDNIASGYNALGSNTTGSFNSATGYYALAANVDGSKNTATGYGALTSNLVVANTAIGYFALGHNTTGNSNTASGDEALYSNTEGTLNTASGSQALYSNTKGVANTAVGYGALFYNTTGSDLTCIGYECTAAVDRLSNATAIGAHAVVGQSNALVLGGTDKYAVKVGIGTTTPSSILTIARGSGHPVSDSWETYSSRRWKTNIQTLPDALAKVEQLRGVSYDRKDSGKHEIGVIAEEVGMVVPEVVSWEKNGTDAQGVDYSRLTALLIEAVKQQQKQLASQREQIRRMRSKDALLESRLAQLQGHVDELRQARRSDLEVAHSWPSGFGQDTVLRNPKTVAKRR